MKERGLKASPAPLEVEPEVPGLLEDFLIRLRASVLGLAVLDACLALCVRIGPATVPFGRRAVGAAFALVGWNESGMVDERIGRVRKKESVRLREIDH